MFSVNCSSDMYSKRHSASRAGSAPAGRSISPDARANRLSTSVASFVARTGGFAVTFALVVKGLRFFGAADRGGVFGGETQVIGGGRGEPFELGADFLFFAGSGDRVEEFASQAGGFLEAGGTELSVGDIFEAAGGDVEARIGVGGAFDFAGDRGGPRKDFGGVVDDADRRWFHRFGGEGQVGRGRHRFVWIGAYRIRA